jgi:hypothetical protein
MPPKATPVPPAGANHTVCGNYLGWPNELTNLAAPNAPQGNHVVINAQRYAIEAVHQFHRPGRTNA